MKKICLLFLFFFIIDNLIAQIKFDKRYPLGLATVGRKVVEIPGGYVSAGANIADSITYNNNIIVKIDYNGDTVKTLFIPPPDSTYWNLYNQDPDDIFTDLIVTPDSNLIALGRTQAYNPSNLYDYDIFLVKLNFNLDTIWVKTFSHPSDTAFGAQSAIQTSDGGFLICGKQRSFTNTDWYGFLYKVDSNGIFQWYKSYDTPGPYQGIWDVNELSNHRFICTGNSDPNSSSLDAFYFFTDSIGNQTSVFPISTLGDDAYDENIISNDSNIILLGLENNSIGSLQPSLNCIVKIDTSGLVIWKKTYGPFNNGSALGIAKAHNGGYIYAGVTDNTASTFIAYIHRLDENGDSLWYREFGSSNYSDFWDLKATTDGGYIMCGQTAGCNNNGGTCFWFVKTDSLGFLTTGIQENENFKNAKLFSIFPNPCKESFSVTAVVPQTNGSGYGKKGASLFLFDATGRQLKEISLSLGVNNLRVDMSGYSPGMYLCVMALDGYNVAQQKIAKE